MTETTDTTDTGAAQRMQDRLERMSEAERIKLYAFMEKSEEARRVMAYALGATTVQLQELLEIIEDDLARRRGPRADLATLHASLRDTTSALTGLIAVVKRDAPQERQEILLDLHGLAAGSGERINGYRVPPPD